jgi:hypothetical protein
MKTVSAAEQVRLVPLSEIMPSPFNPVGRMDETSLKELADSITTHGLQQPIVLMKNPHGNATKKPYVIVCGHRRFGATKLAGKKEVSAIVRELTTEEAREIQVIENLQRLDIHPMEEAEAYGQLAASFRWPEGTAPVDDPPWTRKVAERIASRVGKTLDYVTKRARLLTLIPDAKDCFLRRVFSLDHAILLAALEPDEQLKALRHLLDPQGYRSKGKTIAEMVAMVRDPGKHESYVSCEVATVRELRHFVEEELALDLKKAPWDLADKRLVPEAGACTTCTKRAGGNKPLFGGLVDVAESTCLDSACFRSKREALVQIVLQTVGKADGTGVVKLSHKNSTAKPAEKAQVYKVGQFAAVKKGECDYVVWGVFSDAAESSYGEYAQRKPGSKLTVCVDPSCKKHRKAYQKAKHTSGNRYDPVKEAQQRAERERQVKREKEIRRAIAGAALERTTSLNEPLLRAIGAELLRDRRGDGECKTLLKPYIEAGKKFSELKTDSAEFARALAAALLADGLGWLHEANYGRKEFQELARTLGVNPESIRSQYEKEHPTEPKKADAKTKAKGKAKAAPEPTDEELDAMADVAAEDFEEDEELEEVGV